MPRLVRNECIQIGLCLQTQWDILDDPSFFKGSFDENQSTFTISNTDVLEETGDD